VNVDSGYTYTHTGGSGIIAGGYFETLRKFGDGSLNIDKVHGVYILGDAYSGIDTKYGLYVESVTNATSSNYAIYTNSGNVRFGDELELALSTVTANPTNAIRIGASDTAGESTATLDLHTEQAVEAIGTFTPSNKLKIKINGTEYWIQLDAV
jgi:hypothetical protein